MAVIVILTLRIFRVLTLASVGVLHLKAQEVASLGR
jgi:hypothetical protein